MKILIFAKNWVGDFLFQVPAIEAIRQYYPDAFIGCVVPKRCRKLLESNPHVDQVYLFDEKETHRGWGKRFLFAWMLRRKRFDRVYLFHKSRTRAFLMWIAGIRERIGYAVKGKWFLTSQIHPPQEKMHEVDYFLRLLERSGLDVTQGVPYRFYFSEESQESVRHLLQRYRLESKEFLCFHLGANWEPKRWPVSHFAALADLIDTKWKVPIVVTGTAGDLGLVHELQKKIRKAAIISLVAQTDLDELGALFNESLCLITADSGPMHIASGVGIPVLALFGPTDPQRTGPRGSAEKEVIHWVPPGYEAPWFGKTLPEEGWMSQIQPEQVFEQLKSRKWIRKEVLSREVFTKAFYHGNFQIKADQKSTKEILLITLSNLGDVVMTTPVLMNLYQLHPGARITVVVGPKAKPIIEGSHCVHRVVVYDKKTSLLEKWAFIRLLRETRFDLVVDLRNSAIPFLIRAKKRSPLIRSHREIQMRARHLEILKMMKMVSQAVPHFDFFHESEEQSTLKVLKDSGVSVPADWILIAPIAGSGLKTWPLEKFHYVVTQLIQETDAPVLLIGSEPERLKMDALASIDPKRVINLAGKLHFKEMAFLVSRCKLLLSNDSAAMHVGHELHRCVVAVFGPTHHRKYGYQGDSFKIVREPVSCSPCESPVCHFDRQHCFEDLHPEVVLNACRKLLHEKTTHTQTPA